MKEDPIREINLEDSIDVYCSFERSQQLDNIDSIEQSRGQDNVGFCSIEPKVQVLERQNNGIIASQEDIEVFSSCQEEVVDKRSCYSRFVKSYIGLFFAAFSAFFYSITSLLVKKLDVLDPMELCMLRFVGIAIPAFAICVHGNKNPIGPRGTRVNLLLRGVVGTLCIMTQYYGIRHLPLADASVIIFSAPVFTIIIARIFLKEPCTVFSSFVIVLTLIGVILITKPPFIFGSLEYGYTTENLIGAIVAFVSNIFTAFTFILVRQVKHVHYSVIIFGAGVIGIIVTQVYTMVAGTFCVPPCGLDRYLVIVLGVMSFMGQLFKTLALQYEQAALVSICRTIDIVFAFIWQMVFFNDMPSYLSVIGAFLVVTSVIGIGIQKWLASMPESTPIRKKLRFLLF